MTVSVHGNSHVKHDLLCSRFFRLALWLYVINNSAFRLLFTFATCKENTKLRNLEEFDLGTQLSIAKISKTTALCLVSTYCTYKQERTLRHWQVTIKKKYIKRNEGISTLVWASVEKTLIRKHWVKQVLPAWSYPQENFGWPMRTEDKKGWLDIEEKGSQVALTFLSKKICRSPLVKMHEMSGFFCFKCFYSFSAHLLGQKINYGGSFVEA